MREESKKQSWWHTTAGILTAIAGFITAVTVLIGALNQVGYFDNKENPIPKTSSNFQSVETKILRGEALEQSDIKSLSKADLRMLRNTVYARHGRSFETPEIQHYFNDRSWYTPRSTFSNGDLTPSDRANVKLIQSVENEE